MAKTTTSKTQKTDVAKKPTVAAAKPAVTEKVETVAEVKTDATTVEKAESQEDSKPAVTEKPEQKDESGLPFKVNSDGTVNVWSVKRAVARLQVLPAKSLLLTMKALPKSS